jgi:FAD/FMN-containing dehydrogenase
VSARIETDPDIREMFSADSSGLRYLPDGVARPESIDEVSEVLREASSSHRSITPAGLQTSTTAASITDNGVLLSLRGLSDRLEIDAKARTARASAGVIVGDLKRAAAAEGLLFAPDPTSEDESTIGGAIACNASGARTLKYGATRKHVRAVTVALASGEVREFRRSGLEKNTAGYAIAHDPVDWFVGSEGTLGVVVEAELSLLPLPQHVIGLEIPFLSERDALAFVVVARDSARVSPRCIEYFDELAMGIARASETNLAPRSGAMVYVEQELAEDDDVLDSWLSLAEKQHASADDVRVFEGEQALAAARRVRHSVPATMNERSARVRSAGGRKVSTDWAVPYWRLYEAISAARELARGAGIDQAVTYGHAGNGHPHQNYIARDDRDLERIERVVEETLRMVLSMGGTVSAEHGIGKIKRRWLPLQVSSLELGVMRAVKRELDPDGILAPGNIF